MLIPTFARIGMVGFTGCGKTVAAHWLALHWLQTAGAIFISDPKFSPNGSIWSHWGKTVYSGDEVADAWLEGHRIIRLAGVYGEENYDLLEIACEIPRSRVIIDESATLLPSNLNHAPHCFQRIVNQGREIQQGIMCLGQHYAQLPAGYRLQSYIFSANQSEGSGKDWLKERTGVKGVVVPKFHWLISSPEGEVMTMDPVDLTPPALVERLPNPVDERETPCSTDSESVKTHSVASAFAGWRHLLSA